MNDSSTTTDLSPAFSPSQRESRWLIALVFGGVVLRLLAIVLQPGSLKTDPDAYVAHAETLKDTGGYNSPGSDVPTAYRPPVYPMLLAGMRYCGIKMTVAIGIINVFSGAMMIIASWWMARLAGLRDWWPSIVAAAVAIDPMLLRYSSMPMTETLSGALLSFAVLHLIKARRLLSTPDEIAKLPGSPTKFAIVAGLCFGIGGLCRPVVFVACALLTLSQVAELSGRRLFRKSADDQRRDMTGRIIILPAVVAAMILLPWIIRNALQFNAFIPATTHGGYTLLLGNNPTFYREVVEARGGRVWAGGSLDRWQQQLQVDLPNAGVDQTSQTAVDRWMYERAFATINADPTTFVSACVLRWKRFWALGPTAEAETAGLRWYFCAGWYLMLWIGLVAALELSFDRVFFGPMQSIMASTRDKVLGRTKSAEGEPAEDKRIRAVPDIHLLWLAVTSFLLLHTFYWTNARMRAPLMGILCVLAVVGWRHLLEIWQRRKSQP